MSNSIQINPNVLKHYINNSHVPVESLREQVPKLDLILNDKLNPTFNQISKIAKIINVPTPDICGFLNIRCITMLEFFSEVNLSI